MIDQTISPRYAKVLFDLDCIKGNLDGRLEDFESIINIFKLNPKLVKFLKASQVSMNDKEKMIQDSLRETFEPTFINFISYLIKKKRLVHLSQIANEYRRLVNKYLGRWEADIVTAVSMDSESEEKLIKKLERIFHKKIHLNKQVDPKIIGGAILIISNEMLDWSVTGRLRKLKENLIAMEV